MPAYLSRLNADPRPWLLEPDPDSPAVRYLALRDLLDHPDSGPEVQAARADIMRTGPVPAILSHQHPDGYWVKPGPGYWPNYTATAWQVIFLADLATDGSDPRVQRACRYVLEQHQAGSGGLSLTRTPSKVVHCFNGQLAAALLSLGLPAEDGRIQRALDWQARAILGDDITYFKSGTTGADFGCVANGALPCAWGAVKALKAFAMVPSEVRSPLLERAVAAGIEFLLRYDLAAASYPHQERVSSNWFKLGYPLGYTSDILETLEVLSSFGTISDARLEGAMEFVLSKQDPQGRWTLEHSLNGKMWVDIERKGRPSKWVTLRALRVLRAAFGP